jgi:hypothetical protein
MWGVVGMFLSTPLAVMAMAILAEFKGSQWMAVLLSGDGKPYADDPNEEKAEKPSPARKIVAKARRAVVKTKAPEGP